jgi:hypothetical protein
VFLLRDRCQGATDIGPAGLGSIVTTLPKVQSSWITPQHSQCRIRSQDLG